MPSANLAGSTYTIPAAGSRNWSSLTNYLVALSTDCIQRNGGSFTLLAELSFAGSYGLKVPYLKSTGSNLAAAGVIRLANAESVAWRNAANGADKALKVNASDLLEFDGVAVPTISSSSVLTNKSIDADTNTITNIENADIKALAAIDATKIADGSVTNTEFQYISTLSSNVQTQITDHLADTSTHGVAGAILGTTDTQNVSNKTFIDAITLTEIATPASPSAGTEKIYTKSDGNLYKLNSAGVETRVGSGSGQGEKNYITNPSGEVATTGWGNVGDLDIARTTTAGDLPREYSTATGLKITADANTQSVADYVYFDFTLDDVDLSKTLAIKWAQKVTGTYTAGQLAVGITTQADRTTFLHTPVVTDIPAFDGDFLSSFTTSTTATLSLVIRATGDMTTDGGIVISDVIVGPGSVLQSMHGAPVTTTPTWTNVTTTSATTNTITYTRIGNLMQGNARFVLGASSAVTGGIILTIPGGLTLDTTKMVVASVCGTGMASNFGSARYVGMVFMNSTTEMYISTGAGANTNWDNTVPFSWGNTDSFSIEFTIPIAEWAGSGFVGIGEEEYAYNTDTTNANNTTSFGYGPDGVLFPNRTVGTTVSKTVSFPTPIQATDRIELQIYDPANPGWLPAEARGLGYTVQGATAYGVRVLADNATGKVVCGFFAGGQAGSNATYAGNGTGWDSLYTANWKWRVVKYKKGAPNGFRNATDTNPGLLPYYKTETFNMNGSFTGGTVTCTRIGNVVTLSGTDASHAASSSVSSAAGLIPAAYMPAVERYNVYAFSSLRVHMVTVAAGGVITTAYRDWAGGVSSPSSSAAWSITYTV
jgi:hypothetical protein